MRQRRPLFLEEEEGEESPINLTPLIDVVFVLLITILLLSPLLSVDHIHLAASCEMSKKDVVHTPLSIEIRSDSSIWFQGRSINIQQLESGIKIEKLRSPGHYPQLIADKNSHFGTYQEVKNVLEVCGFEQMDVLLQ